MKFRFNRTSVFRGTTQLLLVTWSIALLGAAFKQSVLEGEAIYLRDAGFSRKTITRKGGKFVLVIINLSHSKSLSLGLKRSDGASEIPVVPSLGGDQNFLVDLPVGQHTLSDPNHPEWPPVALTVTQ